MAKNEKPWGGRFKGGTDREVENFTESLSFDRRLCRHDIEGSIAHARMLGRRGILSKAEEKAIVAGLRGIRRDFERGTLAFSAADEDIHMAVEKELIRRVGDAGAKLHTGRSRNDQVALDLRLWLREEIDRILDGIRGLKDALAGLAAREIDTVLPGYTHLQRAQPILLSHYLLAFWEMLDRDESRFTQSRGRVNVMPLGAGALAGTGIPIDRRITAELLEFPAVSQNSLDAVSDRDFAAEFLFDSALLMMHLSRFCEDLILWSTEEFRFIEISDAFTTGSSLMPQKKNPDVAELVRGKTGRVYGHLVALLTVLKGLPMTYNRDLQEDKEPVFDAADTVKACLSVFTRMLGQVSFRRSVMEEAAAGGFSTATDVAEYLVKAGVPFRDAHGVAGRIVAFSLEKGKNLAELTLEEYRSFHGAFREDIHDAVTVRRSVGARDIPGGTAGKAVRRRLREIGRKRGRTKR
jgi:argininosuccinate lyase